MSYSTNLVPHWQLKAVYVSDLTRQKNYLHDEFQAYRTNGVELHSNYTDRHTDLYVYI